MSETLDQFLEDEPELITGGLADFLDYTGGSVGGIAADGTVSGGARGHRTRTEVVPKDATLTALIPGQISECALHTGKTGVCMSNEAIGAVSKTIGAAGPPAEIVAAAKQKTGCNTEKCVLTRLSGAIGEDVTRRELNANFKVKGPRGSKLLSNVNIDAVMRQWTIKYPDFFPYNFNMRNYASYSYDAGYVLDRPDTLATILFSDLYDGSHDGREYRCCGCIINSDTYQGDGKHWMALFADARADNWTIEFFNSSGNAPAPEWVNWMEKTRVQMENICEASGRKCNVELVRVTDIRHQNSRSECGVYSLFYIWARLHGIPPEYFKSTPIPDQIMFEFRQQLFDEEGFSGMTKFEWGGYQKMVRVEWE